MCNTVTVAEIKNKLVARITEINSSYFIVNFGLIFYFFYWSPAEPLPGAHGTLWVKNTELYTKNDRQKYGSTTNRQFFVRR